MPRKCLRRVIATVAVFSHESGLLSSHTRNDASRALCKPGTNSSVDSLHVVGNTPTRAIHALGPIIHGHNTNVVVETRATGAQQQSAAFAAMDQLGESRKNCRLCSDNKNTRSVISNPSAALRVNSVRDVR